MHAPKSLRLLLSVTPTDSTHPTLCYDRRPTPLLQDLSHSHRKSSAGNSVVGWSLAVLLGMKKKEEKNKTVLSQHLPSSPSGEKWCFSHTSRQTNPVGPQDDSHSPPPYGGLACRGRFAQNFNCHRWQRICCVSRRPSTEFFPNSDSMSSVFLQHVKDHGTSSPLSGLDIEQHLRSIFSALYELLCKLSMSGLSSFFPLLLRLLTRVLHIQVKLLHRVFSLERGFVTWEPIIISAPRWIAIFIQQAPKPFISIFLLQDGSLPSFDSLVSTFNWVSMIARLFRRLKILMTLLSSCLTFL